MSYISHTSYTKMLEAFNKQSTKGILKEGLEKEGNAFTAGLAKTKKGGSFKVGGKEFKDKTNYAAPTNEGEVDEYDYKDNYPGSWGYREGKVKQEGLNPAPLQATGQTTMAKEGSDYNFSVLSQTERDQLTEYIKSMKTIKEEINKLMGKARSGMEEGGDMTNLVMNELGPAAMQTAGEPGDEAEYRGSLVKRRGTASPEEVEKKISPEMHSKVHKTLDALRAALEADGLEGWEIEMFIKHEIEKKGGEAMMGQHDPY